MADAFSFGPFRLYPSHRILRKDGAVVAIGSRAFDMLVAMVEHDGRVLTPAELMARAWPGVTVDDSNVRVQVANLRRALGCGRDGARYIANVAGRGYSFVEPVRRNERASSLTPETSGAAAASSAEPVHGDAPRSRSMSSVPAPLPRVIGRDACVAELAQVVSDRRVVTVVGPAGAGKTTLAILVANARHAYDGAIAFVDLSAVDGDDMVAEAVATAVGCLSPGSDLLPGLLDALSTTRTLIVLDNCEHVIGAVATLCRRIVEGTSTVALLNTSREALRIKEEFVYLLRPLASPPDTPRLTATEAMAWPAVQLFMERAHDGGARDTLGDRDAPAVAGLCRRLDGNPHAIGLVASRVGTYGIQGVADLFERQVALHWQGRRDAIPRHQTVEALIDWSHKLLPERDREVLHRLSVFSGSFPLEAAVAVTSDDALDAFQVSEAIGDLVDKSLVAVCPHRDGTQIRLLETTRTYAATRLARRRATRGFALRHARYYVHRLRACTDPRLMPRTERVGLHALELGNVRAALEWAYSDGDDPVLAADLSCLAAPLFLERGLIRDGKRTCERALEALPAHFRSTRTELTLLDSAAITYYSGGDYEGALRQVVERGLDVARRLEDHRASFEFMAGLHLTLMANGDFQGSSAVCEQYAAMAAAHGGATEAAIAGWMAGSSQHYSGDQVAADASYSASARLAADHELRPLHYFELKERIIAGIGMSRVKWSLGESPDALAVATQVIDDGRVHPDSLYMCVTLCFSVLLGSGQIDQAEALIEELEDVALDYKVAVRRQVFDVLTGQLLLEKGQPQAAIAFLRSCLAMLPPPKMSVVRTDALQSLAEALRQCGDADGALAAIDEAIDLAKKTHGTFNLADLLRTKADVMLERPHVDADAVTAVLAEALHLARSQRARAWEQRIAATLRRIHNV